MGIFYGQKDFLLTSVKGCYKIAVGQLLSMAMGYISYTNLYLQTYISSARVNLLEVNKVVTGRAI